MRLHHAIAVTVAILIGFGVKLFFFPAPIAEADGKRRQKLQHERSPNAF